MKYICAKAGFSKLSDSYFIFGWNMDILWLFSHLIAKLDKVLFQMCLSSSTLYIRSCFSSGLIELDTNRLTVMTSHPHWTKRMICKQPYHTTWLHAFPRKQTSIEQTHRHKQRWWLMQVHKQSDKFLLHLSSCFICIANYSWLIAGTSILVKTSLFFLHNTP